MRITKTGQVENTSALFRIKGVRRTKNDQLKNGNSQQKTSQQNQTYSCQVTEHAQAADQQHVLRLIMKATRGPTIVTQATGCMEIVGSIYPYTSWALPWLHTAFENAAANASGIDAAIKVMRKKGKIKREHIDIIAIAGDGGTYDIGLQALSGAVERGHDFLFVLYDNEGYMNTGIQRSSSTPIGAATTTTPAGSVNPR